MIEMIAKYFGSKYLLPSIIKECKVVNFSREQKSIGDVYLFERNFYHDIYVVEDENVDNIIYVGSELSGFFNVNDAFIEIKNGFSIIGKNSINSEIIIKNIFVKRDSEEMKNNYYSRHIKFIARKIEKPNENG